MSNLQSALGASAYKQQGRSLAKGNRDITLDEHCANSASRQQEDEIQTDNLLVKDSEWTQTNASCDNAVLSNVQIPKAQANRSSTGIDQPGTAGSASAISPRR